MQPADLKAWKTIRHARAVARRQMVRLRPCAERGRRDVIVRSTGADGEGNEIPDRRAAAGGRGGGRARAGGAARPLAISGDSKWVAFTVYPRRAGGRGGRGGRAAAVVAAAERQAPTRRRPGAEQDGAREPRDRREEGIRQRASLLVQRRQADVDRDAELSRAARAGAARGGRRSAALPARAAGRVEGTDLVLYNLATATP